MLISLYGDLYRKDTYFSSEACYNPAKHKLRCMKLQSKRLDWFYQLQVLISNLAEEDTVSTELLSMLRDTIIQKSPFANHLHTPRQCPNQKRLSFSARLAIPSSILNPQLPSTYHEHISTIPVNRHKKYHSRIGAAHSSRTQSMPPPASTPNHHRRRKPKVLQIWQDLRMALDETVEGLMSTYSYSRSVPREN